MSNMGQLVLSVQEMLAENVATEDIIQMLKDKYGFGKESALEFICSIEDEYRRYEY